MLCWICDIDPSLVIKDIQDNTISLSDFKYNKQQFDAAFGLLAHVGKQPRVWVGFEVTSLHSFGKLCGSLRSKLLDTLMLGCMLICATPGLLFDAHNFGHATLKVH